MNMLNMKYEITAEQKQEINEARKKNRDKRIPNRKKIQVSFSR